MSFCSPGTIRSLANSTCRCHRREALGSSHSTHSIAQALTDIVLKPPDNELASCQEKKVAQFHEINADPPLASSVHFHDPDFDKSTLRHPATTAHRSELSKFMSYMRRGTLKATRVVSLGLSMQSVLRPRSPSLHLPRRPKLTLDTNAASVACEERLRSLALQSARTGSDATPPLCTSSSLSSTLSLSSGVSLATFSDVMLSSAVSSGSFVILSPRINATSRPNNSSSAPVRRASVLGQLPTPLETTGASLSSPTQDATAIESSSTRSDPLTTSEPPTYRRATHVPTMHLETTLASHVFSVRLPSEVQPQMVTVFQKRGGRVRVVVDLWHLQKDAHFEWELIMSLFDVDMSSVRALFEADGLLEIHVRRRPLQATDMPSPVIIVI